MRRSLQLVAILSVLLSVTSCKTRTVKVVPPQAPVSVDPEVPECMEADTAALLAAHAEDLDACTASFPCKKTGIRTVTFMLGCAGTMGSLVVLSHGDLGGYNECLVLAQPGLQLLRADDDLFSAPGGQCLHLLPVLDTNGRSSLPFWP